MKHPIFAEFHKIGVIPVLEIDSVELAPLLAESLLAGGLPIAEVTLRTDAAIISIRRIAHEVKDVIVGAGTVINREMIADGKFDEITRMAKEASDIVKQVRRNHS
jgi:2-dehydro-3-deoxyphosphogluconate aldolase / (4S)-4-hydroxy-2-oxoglutarate aldolase